MLKAGELAPMFTLVSDAGQMVSLADFRGKKVVIYFYPKADTPGCTKQACAVRDAYPTLAAKDAVVIGISPDGPEALVKFRQKYNLPFILLSDPDHQVAEAYGVWGEKSFMGKTSMGIVRSHFAVDEEGRLLEQELAVKPETTVELALKLVQV